MADPKRQKPLPRSRRTDFDGNIRFSGKPVARENRAEQIKRSDDTWKNIAIGLQDIDESIMYYFKQIIKPRVFENGTLIDVPIIYGDPSLWAATQKQGYTRDKKGKIINPVVMFRRTSMARDDQVPVDKGSGQQVHAFPKKWSGENNKYDRFGILHNMKPKYEILNVVVPDYVIITYECAVWTSYVTQMNKIVELMQYAEGQFWGDEDKFKFSAKIDSFDQSVEVTTERGRLVRSTFNLEIKGYLIPEYFNDLVQTQKHFTVQQIVLDTETELDIFSVVQPDSFAEKIFVTTNRHPAVTGNQSIQDMINAALEPVNEKLNWLRKLKVYSTFSWPNASIASGSAGTSLAIYPLVYTASAPVGYTTTDEEHFLVFVNGQYVEHDSIYIQQSGSDFVVVASTGSLGYSFALEDEIVVWGKFL